MLNTHKKICIALLGALIAALLVVAGVLVLAPSATAVAEESGSVASDEVATVAVGDGEPTGYLDILDAWDAANAAATSQDAPAVVTLLANVTTEYCLTMTSGSFVTLDLNGYALRYVGDIKSPVITVKGVFTLQDSQPQAEHRYNVSDKGLWALSDNGDHTLYGGVISGGSRGGVNVDSGSFTMNGGSVVGNYASIYGSVAAGVHVNEGCEFTLNDGAISGNTDYYSVYVGGTFTMNGGSISHNKAEEESCGVYVSSGAFTMTGGAISNNTSPASAVMVRGSGATFAMSGGEISNNVSSNDAGGVTVTNGCSFTMSGTAAIIGNTGVYWGGVFMSGGTVVMEGGEICDNTATSERSQGGGLFFGGAFTMTGGKISGNKAANGGGVYASGGTFEMSGLVDITGNKATDDTDSNVYLRNNALITVADELIDGARIGVNSNGVIANGFTQADEPSKYFIPDNSTYSCIYLSDADNGEITLNEHDYQADFTVDVEPTCESAGSKSKHCSHCDSVTDVTAMPALGHDYGEWTVVTQPTQQEEGLEQRVCSRDDAHVETRVPKLPVIDPDPQPQPDPTEQPADAQWIWTVLLVVLLIIVLFEVFLLVYIVRLKFSAGSNGKGGNNK